MTVIDGHSHMYQTFAPARELKKTVKDIEGFDMGLLLKRLDEIEVSQFQTMPQEMTRIQGNGWDQTSFRQRSRNVRPEE